MGKEGHDLKTYRKNAVTRWIYMYILMRDKNVATKQLHSILESDSIAVKTKKQDIFNTFLKNA